MEYFIQHYDIPHSITSDQEAHFTAREVQAISYNSLLLTMFVTILNSWTVKKMGWPLKDMPIGPEFS